MDVRAPQLLTPLMVAVLNFHCEDPADLQLIIQALVAAKADLNAVDEDGTTALAMAISHIVHSDNNKNLYSAPASACIALIEAGQEKAPCRV